MSKGIIYVCSTAINGLVKIGRTTDFESRMSNLERDGYRNVASVKREFAIEVENHEEIEKLLHNIFAKSRLGDTELFSLNIDQVKQLLSAFQGTQIYPNPSIESKQDVFLSSTEAVATKELINGDFYIDYSSDKKGVQYYGHLSIIDGISILKKGSVIIQPSYYTKGVSNQTRNTYYKLLIENNVLIEDYHDISPSLAASLIIGNSVNGWDKWIDKNGNKLDSYRKKEIDED